MNINDNKIQCEYCDKFFSSKTLLLYHQNNTKYCLEIQNKTIQKSKCDFCSKELTITSFKKHLEKCKLKSIKESNSKMINELREEIELLKEQMNEKDKIIIEKDKIIQEKNNDISALIDKNNILIGKNEVYKSDQECLHKIAQQTKTTSNINHITNNLAIYDADLIANNFKNALNNITPEDICEGQSAVAKIIAPCLTNSDGMKMIACTDKSRGVFVTKDSDGKISKDIKAKKLVDTIEPIASMKVDEIVSLEKEKKDKSRDLFTLKSNIRKRTEEIENLEDTLCGFKKNSNEYNRISKQIEQLHDRNNEEYEQIRVYEEEGVIEINYDVEHTIDLDTKLLIGASEIKDIKSNPNKFSNTLGNMV